MTPLPAALLSRVGGRAAAKLVVWRLERSKYLPAWDTAEGAFLVGGRWSSAGRRVLYTSVDPATSILEVAVHKGFKVLDEVPHTLLKLHVAAANVRVVRPHQVLVKHWLRPGAVSPQQQKFGDALLDQHGLLLVPSVVSTHSWNLLIKLPQALAWFKLRSQESFALDPRLTPS